jgi:hypothetical protein
VGAAKAMPLIKKTARTTKINFFIIVLPLLFVKWFKQLTFLGAGLHHYPNL